MQLKPNHKRARNAQLLLGAMILLDVIGFISGYLQYKLLTDAQSGISVTSEAANANDLREQIIVFIDIGVYIVSIVVFIQWFRRAYYNLHIKVPDLEFAESAAASSWFIPFINLVRPFKIMKELYVNTNMILLRNGIDFENKLNTSIVVIWWTLWITNNICGRILYSMSKSSNTIEELLNTTICGLIAHIVGIALGIVAIKMVNNYSLAEDKMIKFNTEFEFLEDYAIEKNLG